MPLDQAKSDAPGKIVGLIPAGGIASRMSPLPCSKEILPIGTWEGSERHSGVQIASGTLLESMRLAGVETAYWVLRDGKWDIPSFFGNGHRFGLSMAYLVTHVPYGVPYTLHEAVPFIGDARVLLGFPDVVFRPVTAFSDLLKRQYESGAAITLALFAVDHPESADVVEYESSGLVRRIHVKPDSTQLNQSWMLAVWTAEFTRFMRDHVEEKLLRIDRQMTPGSPESRELYVGHVIQAAIDEGFHVEAVPFPNGRCIDVGTMEGWKQVLRGEFHEPLSAESNQHLQT